MFKKMLGRKPQKPASTISTLEKLNETLEMLEKKENFLQKKISMEIQKAKDYTKSKNKKAAIQSLKKKKLYEAQVEQLGNYQLRVHDQMIMLESAKATTETVDALRTGASAMMSIQQSLNVDDIDKTMEEVNEQNENMKQIQEALATPVGSAADIDEDELEAELEELEEAELEEQMLQAPDVVPQESLPPANLPMKERQNPASRPDELAAPMKEKQKPTSEVDDLAALQAEMAL